MAEPKKRCSRCSEEKPETAEFFPADKRKKNGLGSWCRACLNRHKKEQRTLHPEGFREAQARNVAARLEKWGGPTPPIRCGTRVCAKCKVEKPATSEHFQQSKWVSDGCYSKCRPCARLDGQEARAKNPERARNQSREWTKKNRDRVRELSRNYRLRTREKVLRHYSNGAMNCSCCGEAEFAFLCLDHIEGGGREHRQNVHDHVYAHLARHGFPAGYQVLCWNCNSAKFFYKQCPHKNVVLSEVA